MLRKHPQAFMLPPTALQQHTVANLPHLLHMARV